MSTPPPDIPELRRLLVVDDEEIVLVALRETLVRAGYDVVATGEASQALEALRQRPFSVIITDQQMPQMTGLEFLAQARVLRPDATRILITAVLNLSTVIDAINKGEIYRFIVKPWLREEFLGAIESAVQRYQLISGNSRLRARAGEMDAQVVSLQHRVEELDALERERQRDLDRLTHRIDEVQERAVSMTVDLISTYLPTLGNQAARIRELCRSMGRMAGLSGEDLRVLDLAARLHDLGLLAVPRPIVRRWQHSPGSLHPEEQAVLELHPVRGSELALALEPSETLRAVIRSHHERFDGTGFPDRLAGHRIPWLGRLLAVAVAYAESNHEHGPTIERMREAGGSAFDPEALLIFLRSLPHADIPRKQREVALSELRPGMVLAKGIYTSSGILLIPDGHELNSLYIDKLRNHHRTSPLAQSLLVYC